MSESIYDDGFFDLHLSGALRSARIIVPLVMELISPESVIDIGCGRGAWLKAFEENGVRKLRGLDGEYVNQSKFLVDADCFAPTNLNEPIELHEGYELAVCLEVAEHLDARAGESLIETLVTAAPVVLFSAAVPGQGGTHHVNEQWSSYWAGLFGRYDFQRLDPIRRHIWQDERVDWFYRQNIFMYASTKAIKASPQLQAELEIATKTDLELISVAILNQYRYPSIRRAIKEVSKAIQRSMIRRFAR